MDDSLPDLDGVHALGGRYDLIMQTAVWIHLDLHQHGRAADGPAVGKFAERLAAFEAAKAARATA